MDSLITGAAHALATGDPLGALNRVALREDAPALALRGIAMAQLGEYKRGRELLRRAGREFGAKERLARARCELAEAEVALAARDLSGKEWRLEAVARTLEQLGDSVNAAHARLIAARRFLLVGEVNAAEAALEGTSGEEHRLPRPLLARAELTRAELALRRLRVADAAAALQAARTAAQAAGIPALLAEIERASHGLTAPAARILESGTARVLRLDEVEAVLTSDRLIVDGCRRVVRGPGALVSLAGRPVLFDLLRALAEPWPVEATRESLIARAFSTRVINESHRVRLRVELSRLRALVRPLATIEPTAAGFVLTPRRADAVVVLAPLHEGSAGAVLALLEDGGSWSTSALARAIGTSQRSVQRMLQQLQENGAVRALGEGRSRRWLAPSPGGFATTLLLPGSLALR